MQTQHFYKNTHRTTNEIYIKMDNDIKIEDEKTNELNNDISSLNIDYFTNDTTLDNIQNNVFNIDNNKIYMSGNYNNSLITSQGIFKE